MECRRICQRLFGREDKEILNYVSDALRAIDETVWLRAALINCGRPEHLVLDSLRYEPDLAFAREQGLVTVAVELDDAIRLDRLRERGQEFDPGADDAHVSERALGGVRFDHVIANDGSRSDLERAVEGLLRQVD